MFCKTTNFVQYQSIFFHVPIGKFYTWLNCFTQPAVVMVVTNMKCVLNFAFALWTALLMKLNVGCTISLGLLALQWTCTWCKHWSALSGGIYGWCAGAHQCKHTFLFKMLYTDLKVYCAAHIVHQMTSWNVIAMWNVHCEGNGVVCALHTEQYMTHVPSEKCVLHSVQWTLFWMYMCQCTKVYQL